MVDNDITLSYMNQCFKSMGPITIDQEFIDYRKKYADKFNDYGRTQEEKIRNSDGLLPEYLLIKAGLVKKSKTIHSDFGISEKLIDNKMINEDANTVTIPNRKIDWMKDAVVSKLLTHFSVTRWTSRPNECKGENGRPLQVGDIVTFEVISVLDARDALKSVENSIWYADSKYFWAK
jgi:hypothetical protein